MGGRKDRVKGSADLRREIEEAEAAAKAQADAKEAALAGADPELPPEPGAEPDTARTRLEMWGEPFGQRFARKLPRELTPAERSVRFGELQRLEAERKTLEGEAKASAFEFRDKLKAKDAEITGALSSQVVEEVPCEMRVDFRGNVKRVIRLDTLEMISEEPLDANDRQLALDGVPLPKSIPEFDIAPPRKDADPDTDTADAAPALDLGAMTEEQKAEALQVARNREAELEGGAEDDGPVTGEGYGEGFIQDPDEGDGAEL